MKTKTTLVIVSLLIASAGLLSAHENESVKASSVNQSIKGEVIDVTCYAGHGAMGSKHSECAKSCLSKGLPAAILSSEGKLYMTTGVDHKNASDLLAKFGGENVEVKGKLTEKNGVKFIQVESVSKL